MVNSIKETTATVQLRSGASKRPSASYSITMRVRLDNKVGMIGAVASAIGRAAGDVGAMDLVQVTPHYVVRDLTVDAASVEHAEEITQAVRQVLGVEVINVSDRTFLMHLGGKIEVHGKAPMKTRDDLSMAYTPGVARVCMAIHDQPEQEKKTSVLTRREESCRIGLAKELMTGSPQYWGEPIPFLKGGANGTDD